MAKKGFLLFEVIISIVIITSGLLYIMHSYSQVKNSIQRSSEVFKISLLMEDKMWELEERGEVSEGEDDGDFKDYDEYGWALEVKPLEKDSYDFGESKLSVVELRVFKKIEKEKLHYSLFTYLKSKFL